MSATQDQSKWPESARDTRVLILGSGVLDRTAQVFKEQFPGKTARPIADLNTLPFAEQVAASGLPTRTPLLLTGPGLYAEYGFVEQIENALRADDVIPLAIGSGTINDLVKLASHRLGRPYMCIATAASMDGYTAFGASITHQGSKQTFSCPAPAAVLADVDIIRTAPAEMGASGYADLLSKVTAGADWILADALEEEAMDSTAWSIVQDNLHAALSDPAGVRQRDPQALTQLTEGLMLGGFAMQSHRTSRPASGAEHQFSHLWDMQHHTFQGKAPSHGFKVGIATLAVTALYERLLELPLQQLNVERLVAQLPEPADLEEQVRLLFSEKDLRAVAARESFAKHPSRESLARQLLLLRRVWPEATRKLRDQLVPFHELRRMLEEAGAPTEPEMIGISRERLRHSYQIAYFIRRRFTVLDLAMRTGLLDSCLDVIFGPDGVWADQVIS